MPRHRNTVFPIWSSPSRLFYARWARVPGLLAGRTGPDQSIEERHPLFPQPFNLLLGLDPRVPQRADYFFEELAVGFDRRQEFPHPVGTQHSGLAFVLGVLPKPRVVTAHVCFLPFRALRAHSASVASNAAARSATA